MESGRTGSQYSDQNWLRSFIFTLFGTSVLVVSYFPLFYTHLGFSSTQVGLLYSLGPLISILSNLFWSMMSDRLGTIKKIMAILLAGQLVTAILLAKATDFSMVMLIISLFYFFYYPVFPLADTMAIKVAQRHGRNFIAIRVFGSLGYSFFALTIGYVLRALGSSYSIGVCIVIIIAALLLSIGLKDVKRSPDADGNTGPSPKSAVKSNGLKEILLQKEVLWFFGCVFILALGHRMNEAFLTLSLKSMNAGDDVIGWALLASALSEIPIFFLLSKYGERFKELPLLAFASLMYGMRFLFMSLAVHPGAIIAIQALHSISFGIFYVTAVRYITRVIPDHLRATGLALFTVVWSSASGLLSGTFGGLIYEDAGRRIFYLVATFFSVLAFIGFFTKHLLDIGGPSRGHFRKRVIPAVPPESEPAIVPPPEVLPSQKATL
ncbi:MFS transporter [Paenibacillus typhae]|uniref:MFS transporter, PPP family, 3-phenylpropionic acid transporter n=1 Tax=Paenibacillus typhae TaxID=1174501 RepID=A0A1G8F046_9BACL|nr:MFS transporter [Paenibacillus typhae]SDH75492.1 MFS transporter, PPP family, 3-phenylpropionic acid transporter [Paenibacillus typhae]